MIKKRLGAQGKTDVNKQQRDSVNMCHCDIKTFIMKPYTQQFCVLSVKSTVTNQQTLVTSKQNLCSTI